MPNKDSCLQAVNASLEVMAGSVLPERRFNWIMLAQEHADRDGGMGVTGPTSMKRTGRRLWQAVRLLARHCLSESV